MLIIFFEVVYFEIRKILYKIYREIFIQEKMIKPNLKKALQCENVLENYKYHSLLYLLDIIRYVNYDNYKRLTNDILN